MSSKDMSSDKNPILGTPDNVFETARQTVEDLKFLLTQMDDVSQLNEDLDLNKSDKENNLKAISTLINEDSGLLTLFKVKVKGTVDNLRPLKQLATSLSYGLTRNQFFKIFTGAEKEKLLDLGLTTIQIERLTRRNSKVLPDNLSRSSFKNDDDVVDGDKCLRIDGIDSTGEKTFGCLSETGNFFFEDNSDIFNYRNFYAVKNNETNKETYSILGNLETIPKGYTEIKHDYNQVRNIAGGKRRTRRNRKCNNTKKCRNQKKFRSRRH